ncbi:DNA helicase UvrD, partial [Candidatus Microgenomates bacterium]|nr:DNA helicase UvrD [Candidatus Microgenomates bacterium]
MKIVTDLHIHSKYSRAVSPKMEILEIGRWARKKGIDLVATGDWTHPLWLREIKANLEEDGSGLLRIKESSLEVGPQERSNLSRTVNSPPPKFLLSTEISSIYTQGGKGRRIHTLIFAPSIAVVEKINKELTKKGMNLISDGRPIIGLSAKDLAEL